MRTYVSHVQVNSGDIMPIGPTLYGVCNTSPAILTKRVSLSMFDRLVHGVTVAIKFTYGNTAVNNVKLQVADTLAFPILGDCTCGSNEVISFTFEELDANNKYWHAHTSGLSDNIKNYIINQINTSTDTPDVFIMKGSVGIGGNPGSLPTSGYEIGWAYRVISDGTYAGQGCKTGELIIAIANATPNQTSINADHWMIVPAKLDSVVVGPDYAHDGHIALFDGPTGERIKESPYTIEASVPGNAVFTDTTYTAGAGLQLDTDTNEFSVQFGTTENTVTQGNDLRLSDARHPLPHEHGNIYDDGTLNISDVNALLKIDNEHKIAAGPILSTSASNKFLNEQGTWVPVVLTINNTLTPDSDGNVTITAESLGLGQGIRFIGSVAANSPYKPSDETAPTEQTPLVINGLNPYTPQPGDIIIDHEDNKEYIYTGAGWWEQFGQDGSFKILQNTVTKPVTATEDHFVQSISQNENGEITVTYARVESITGNAVTATTLETPREIYVNLSQSRDSEHPITFDGSTDISISVNGILPIEHGGTGTGTLSPNQILLTNNAQTATEFITHAYIDNATVIALSTSDSFITERTVYYGLPYINHSHTYNSYDDFYMPETSGSSAQILISGGTNNAPVWATEAKIHETTTANNILTCTTLELGSTNTSQEGAVSEGQIKLYSSGAGAHIIRGVATSIEIEHVLPAADGIIIQMPSSQTTVGGPYQPVYVNTNGIITAITYVAKRIYYSANGTDYIASGHYIDDDKIIISLNNLDPGTITDALYVNGNAATTGDISVGGDAVVGNDLTVTVNATINGTTDAEETNGDLSGALVVAGGASITKKLIVGGHASFRATAEVLANMSIGLELESNPDYALTIKHSTKAIKILGTNDAAAYMDIGTDTNTQYAYLTFIPNTDTTGYIGTTEHRWKEGYFSDLLRIGEANGDGVTIENNGTVTIASSYSSSSSSSCIILKSINTSVTDWVLQNTNGIFELSDSENVNLIGNASGFELQSHLYINPDSANNDSLDLYVNGRTQLTGHIGIGITPDNVDALTINGNTTIVDSNGNAIAHLNIETIDNVLQASFFPSITNTGILGQGGNTPYRWGKLYIGSADEYGDSYAPIYWHDGVPTPISGIVQYHLFTIAANSTSVTIYSDAYTTDTFVLLTVVISGESTLTAPIDWEANNGSITLRTATVTANVSGYILTARGCTAP